ncbi:MAG: hypothetical protein HYZ17_08605 [Betaproteobacteria bacterium]|nr:MAG: hypothetical protein F9K47_08695 [Burkholderiales bacterium]MBI3148556.1 hypothetical protein [Betaproteobacteria bacterium]
MTTLDLKLTLPDQLAREAQAAGLLTPEAMEEMLRERLRKRAGEQLLSMMQKLHDANTPPMSMDEIQEEVRAVRAERGKNARS